LQQRRDAAAKDFAGKTNFDTSFGNLKQGVTFTQPDLAAVLRRIADEGAEDFYNGETADLIAASMRGHGLITKRDLQEYRAVWRALSEQRQVVCVGRA
jgi:gamma-glutamyltranspeptidase/glutathione hydrolase